MQAPPEKHAFVAALNPPDSKLNDALRDALNPKMERIGQRAFGLHDKVMQLRNNYELDVYNGDISVIKQINYEIKELVVELDDRQVLYSFDNLDELTLAYASTVHKAQGSQWDDVVLFDESFAFRENRARWLYTGITRAAQRITVVR